MDQMHSVRLATPRDEGDVVAMCRELHAENGPHPLDEDKLRDMLRRAFDGEGGIIAVIGPPGDLRGCIYLSLEPIWFSQDYQLAELFNYVRPEHRKSGYAKALISYAKSCADSLGIDLMIGVLSNIRMEAKVRLYGRLVPKAGEFFVYRPASYSPAA